MPAPKACHTAQSCFWLTWHSMPRANRYTIIDLVPPRKKISKHIKIGTWKLSLGGGAKRELHLTDGSTGLNLSSPPKKGRLFGKSRASDFVRRIPGNTKALNYYFELNFCRQCVHQWQFRICDTCHLNKLTIASILRNCFSESPWKGSDRQVESEKWLHTSPFRHKQLTKSGTRSWSAAPRLSSEREFGKQWDFLWTSWLNGRSLLLPLIRFPLHPP